MSTGQPGEPGDPGRGTSGGAGGSGGPGGVPGGVGGAGGAGGRGGASDPSYFDGRRRFRRMVMASMLLAAASFLVSSVLFVNAKDAGQENRDLICAMSRLIAHVPAIQFEGEPLDNFIGWIESRRDMLQLARGRGQCASETIGLLEERVRLDAALLKELKANP